ncbi:hypothetical protein CI102_12711 [Trichoderma harzianum]|uniref:Uncharacterized protein n=1 Tax=Trichoderma harzianum CBS 226.95 TaxID=983964 RepID=A0A2T4AAS0_TRIHA|nr:hypothetical protein M431DRAFT_496106 [Trichoderma harzianum CBS 226.95]PKK42959.1 hypothetical protein CI102_12711 [Trichoderma harzianum]PTB54152.1 hypothetical protein M431DRAFT_496106 [Trichoderma harzianum CBS 226.95]
MSLLIHLTPLLILILLYRLCPAHFPPSPTTSRLFILYSLICNLLAHRTSPWPLIQNLVLLILAHVLLAAIYFLHYLAKFACLAKEALLPVYADFAESVQLSVRNIAAHIHGIQLDEVSRDKVIDKDEKEDHFTDELEINSKPELYKSIDSLADPVDVKAAYTPPPPEETFQLRQSWTSSIFFFIQAQLLRLHEFVQLSVLYVLHFYSICLWHAEIITSLYNQASLTLYITRIRVILLIKRSLEPFRRVFSKLTVLGNLCAPAITIFALHFIVWSILLSFGELYVLFVCLLCIFWILSWLS